MLKNIIVVNDYAYVQGGASLVAIETANAFSKLGYNVYFFAGVNDLERPQLLNENIKLLYLEEKDNLSDSSLIKGAIRDIYNVKSKKAMKKLLKEINPSETLISIHGYTKSLTASFIKVCKKAGCVTTLTGHDYFSICPNGGLFNYKKNKICTKEHTFSCPFINCDSRNYLFKMYRNLRFFYQNHVFKLRKNVDYLITISDTSENLLKPYFKNSKIVRIYNPTSIETKNDCIDVSKNDYFLFAGRLDKEKGINLLCETFKQLNQKLVIAGNGNEFEKLKECYKDCNNITFLGWVNHIEVLRLMKGAKCLMFPSLWYEGAPLTIIEAQSLGLPVIASNCSSAKDFVKEDGWIYDPYIENSLRDLVNNLTESEIKEKSVLSYNKYWDNPLTRERYQMSLQKLIDTIDQEN